VRGFSPSVRACLYGTANIKEYVQKANDNTMIIAHCESKTCIENLDEILKVEGIDVMFIGPMDLSQSLGLIGETANPLVKGQIDFAIEKIKKSGKAVGTTAGSAEAALDLIKRGVRYILYKSDQGMLMGAGKQIVSAVKGGMGLVGGK
jgi:4-hydroxy-2-oxoheptanedioate aldolase